MDNSTRTAVLAVLDDCLAEIEELEHAMLTIVTPGDETEAVTSLRKMIIEKLNAK